MSEVSHLQVVVCPHCKTSQFYSYGVDEKQCAVPTCAKTFKIEYDLVMLKDVITDLFKQIKALRTTRPSTPLKSYRVKTPKGDGIAWH